MAPAAGGHGRLTSPSGRGKRRGVDRRSERLGNQEDGVAVDDVTLPDGTSTSFETGLDGWEVTGPPAGSAPNLNNWVRIDPSSLPSGDTDGGPGLDFDFPADLNGHAQNYRDAAVTNLYYLNNVIHDVITATASTRPRATSRRTTTGAAGPPATMCARRLPTAAEPTTPTSRLRSRRRRRRHAPNADVPMARRRSSACPTSSSSTEWEPSGRNYARFSPAPTDAGAARQRIVYASTGCDAGLYPDPLPASNWVVIVDGGTTACSYLQRVQIAESLGAKAVIVAHNTTTPTPILSSLMVGTPAGIPAVGISQADGNTIKAAIVAGPTTGKRFVRTRLTLGSATVISTAASSSTSTATASPPPHRRTDSQLPHR